MNRLKLAKILFFVTGLSALLLSRVDQTTADTKNIECPAKELRLDAPGGPLAEAPVQDQDGLDICYANSASLLLQAAMPGHPELSAIDLSVHAYKDVEERNVNGRFTYPVETKSATGEKNTTEQYFNEIGFVCDAINAAKVHGVCPRNHSAVESGGILNNNHTDPAGAQSVILSEAAQYISAMQKMVKRSPNFSSRLKSSAPELRKLYQKNLAEHKTQPPGKGTHVQDALTQWVDEVYVGESNATKRELAKKRLKEQFSQSYDLQLSTDESVDQILEFEVLSFQDDYPEFVSEMNKRKAELTPLLAQDKDYKRIANPTYGFMLDSVAYFSKSPHWQGCEDDMAFMRGNLNFVSDAFGKVGAYLEFENFLNHLENPEVNVILGAIAPGCLKEENRVKLPENLSCIKYSFPDPKPVFNANKQVTNADQIFANARNRILWSLLDSKKPSPVSIGICSAAIMKKKIDPTLNREADCAKAGGFSHAVTLIGARKNVKTGSCEFLIQNSWGADCSQVGGRECRDGKFWMTEEDLTYNMSSIQKVIEKQP